MAKTVILEVVIDDNENTMATHLNPEYKEQIKGCVNEMCALLLTNFDGDPVDVYEMFYAIKKDVNLN